MKIANAWKWGLSGAASALLPSTIVERKSHLHRLQASSIKGFDAKKVAGITAVGSAILGVLPIPKVLKFPLFAAGCSFSAAYSYIGTRVQQQLQQLPLERKESTK